MPRLIPRLGLVSLLLIGLILTLAGGSPGIGQARAQATSCAQGLGQPLGELDATDGLPARFTLLNWNIQKSGSEDWDEDLLRLGSEAHLLFLQEANRDAGTARVLPQPLYQAFAAGYKAGDVQTGVLTLSTVAPSVQCALTAWEPWLSTPKATSITEFPLAGRDQRLLTVNLHAVNFSVGTAEFMDQIETLAALLQVHHGPLIIAGDFNTWSGKRMRLLRAFMTRYDLEAVDFADDKRTTFWSRPLDHVFLRGLRATATRVVEVDSSDHNPIVIEMELL